MKQKHVGVGNQDTTQGEWLANVKRDTYHSLLSHSSLLEYTTLAKNQHPKLHEHATEKLTKKQMKWELLTKMANATDVEPQQQQQ